MNYIARNIDAQLMEWKSDPMRKPLLLRGARQVGKSSAIRHLGETFQHFAEVNFERNKAIKSFFQGDIDVHLISQKIGKTITVVELYRTLPNKNKEVLLRLAYNLGMAKEAARQAIREDLQQKGKDLHEQLDKALGFAK